MRYGSPELQQVLKGSFDIEWSADVYYNGSRTIANLPISPPSMDENSDADVQQSGSCTVIWSDEFATSLSPRFVTDPLAPYGARLSISVIIHAGTFSERVQYGWFAITDVPSARDENMEFRGQQITTGSLVELELKELLADVAVEEFDAPEAPASLLSTWAEIGRITGLPLSRTVPDASIPRSFMYPERKIEAVYELLDVVLDATPHMTADGALAARPNTWPSPVADLTMADDLVDVGNMMSAEEVYNRVIVRAVGSNQARILAQAEVTSGPLRVRNEDGTPSPFRRRTLQLSSETITSTAAALTWARSKLAQVSQPRSQVLPVETVFNPLWERGDVVTIERPDRILLGRIRSIRRGSLATQQLTIEISGEV